MGTGDKVKSLIDKYVVSKGIDPSIPPISIMDKDFESFLNGQQSDKAKASEMEHAIRHHISEKYEDDPVFFQSLSERLEEVIAGQNENWKQLFEDMKPLLEKAKIGRGDEAVDGLSPEQMPYYDLMKELIFKDEELTDTQKSSLIELTIEMYKLLTREVDTVDFWNDGVAQKRVKRQMNDFISTSRLVGISDFELKDGIIDRLFGLIHHKDNK